MRTFITFVLLAAVAGGAAWLVKPDIVERVVLAATHKAGVPAPTASRNGVEKKRATDQATPVEVAEARSTRTSVDIQAVGSLLSDESVMIAPEIAGRISEIVFEEGRPVRKGQAMVKLDDSLARAELTQAKARLELATANNDRARALSRTGNVTERSRDEATATYETAKAEVELAETRLLKHVLTAPFDGIAGVRAVSVGAYVAIGTKVVNIEKIDQLKIDFRVPEIHLRDVRVGQELAVGVDALPKRMFRGEIYAINPMIDVNGRALVIRGRIANPDLTLRPGLFARIELKGLSESAVVLVPESAILPRAGETFLFVVGDDGKAIERRVRLGMRRNGEVEIVDGVEAPATVVVAGQQRLKSGDRVEIVPPTAESASRRSQKPERAAGGGSG
ncbi:MAG: efflux RND transporter periplasmic adaptor subunit [Hyphomicrobiaceae bacterium]|nr:efflux RND transporter periplasmic adaptor subunit [Hyphomicrobiaceae bacterium]